MAVSGVLEFAATGPSQGLCVGGSSTSRGVDSGPGKSGIDDERADPEPSIAEAGGLGLEPPVRATTHSRGATSDGGGQALFAAGVLAPQRRRRRSSVSSDGDAPASLSAPPSFDTPDVARVALWDPNAFQRYADVLAEHPEIGRKRRALLGRLGEQVALARSSNPELADTPRSEVFVAHWPGCSSRLPVWEHRLGDELKMAGFSVHGLEVVADGKAALERLQDASERAFLVIFGTGEGLPSDSGRSFFGLTVGMSKNKNARARELASHARELVSKWDERGHVLRLSMGGGPQYFWPEEQARTAPQQPADGRATVVADGRAGLRAPGPLGHLDALSLLLKALVAAERLGHDPYHAVGEILTSMRSFEERVSLALHHERFGSMAEAGAFDLLQRQLVTAEQQLEESREQFRQSENRVADAVARSHQLTVAMRSLASDNYRLGEEKAALEGRIESFEQSIADLRMAHDAVCAARDEARNEAHGQRERFEQQREALEGAIAALEGHRDTLQRELAEHGCRYQVLENDRNVLDGIRRSLERDVQALQQERDNTAAEMHGLSERVASLEAKLRRRNNRIQNYKAELSDAKRVYDKQVAAHRATQQHLDEVNAALIEAQDEMARAAIELEAGRDQLTRSRAEHEDTIGIILAENTQLSDRLSISQQATAVLEEQLQQVENARQAEQEAALEAQRAAVATHKAELEAVRRAAQAEIKKNSKQLAKVKRYRTERNAARAERNTARAERDTARRALDSAQAEANTVREELNRAHELLSTSQQANQVLETQLLAEQTQREATELALRNAQAALADLRAGLENALECLIDDNGLKLQDPIDCAVPPPSDLAWDPASRSVFSRNRVRGHDAASQQALDRLLALAPEGAAEAARVGLAEAERIEDPLEASAAIEGAIDALAQAVMEEQLREAKEGHEVLGGEELRQAAQLAKRPHITLFTYGWGEHALTELPDFQREVLDWHAQFRERLLQQDPNGGPLPSSLSLSSESD